MASLFEIKILPMYFVSNVKSLLFHRVNSYSTHLMCIPRIIFITKKFSFIVRLLHFVCIRSVLKLKYERYIMECSVHHTPVLFNNRYISQYSETFDYIGYAQYLITDIYFCKISVYDTQCAFYWRCPRTFRTTLVSKL